MFYVGIEGAGIKFIGVANREGLIKLFDEKEVLVLYLT